MDTITAVAAVIGSYLLESIQRVPHLYAITAAVWITAVVVLFRRYARRDDAGSRRSAVALGVIAGLGAVVGAVDLAIRGRVEFVHISLVAYCGLVVGIGRLVIRRFDRRPTALRPAFVLRLRSYSVMLVLALGFTALADDPWWFDLPTIEGPVMTVLTSTNWLHLQITAVALAAVLDLACTVLGRTPMGRKAVTV